MAPSCWWAINSADSHWCLLSSDDGSQATFLQRTAASQLQPRLRTAFASVLDAANTVMADDMSPELHGTTINNEKCKCLPKSLNPPKTQWLLRKAFDGTKATTRTLRRSEYHQRLDVTQQGTEQQLGALYKAQKSFDYAFADLSRQHKSTEKAADGVKEAFASLKDAYTEGNCAKVVEKAEQSGNRVPECQEVFAKAAKDMKDLRELIAPGCKVGAVKLFALQPPSKRIATEQLMPIAPDALIAMSSLLQREVGQLSPYQMQQRASKASEIRSFL